MSQPLRRSFLKQCLVAGTAWGLVGKSATHLRSSLPRNLWADLALINATVYTVDDRQPKTEAFAVSQGRFIAIGGTDEIRKLIKRNTQVIDAAGMTVVPGFIDVHITIRPIPAFRSCCWSIAIAAQSPRSKRPSAPGRTRRQPASGSWDSNTRHKLKDDRPLSRADLDEAAPNIRCESPIAADIRASSTAWP